MNLGNVKKASILLLAAFVSFSCHKGPEENGGGQSSSVGDPIAVVNGTVRFYI